MITNAEITIYHKEFDSKRKKEKWRRFNYDRVWKYGGVGSSINKGYDVANDIDIRIPYNKNEKLNIKNFSVGDIIVIGKTQLNINRQQDLSKYEIYNITSIINNTVGIEPHIHIGGK